MSILLMWIYLTVLNIVLFIYISKDVEVQNKNRVIVYGHVFLIVLTVCIIAPVTFVVLFIEACQTCYKRNLTNVTKKIENILKTPVPWLDKK